MTVCGSALPFDPVLAIDNEGGVLFSVTATRSLLLQPFVAVETVNRYVPARLTDGLCTVLLGLKPVVIVQVLVSAGLLHLVHE